MSNYRYRTKTIKSGDLVEVEIYPVYTGGRRLPAAKQNTTPEAMQKINRRNAEKKFIRLVNANFTAGDLFVTCTHEGDLPTAEEAERDMRNFIARIRYRWKKSGRDMNEFKYIYVMEYRTEEEARQRGRRKIRLHHHLLLPKGLEREEIEKIWKHGGCDTRRLKPDVYGPALLNLAGYLAKDPRGTRRWGASLNLKKPKVTISDGKITRHRAGRMGSDEYERNRTLEKLYPACELIDVYSTINSYNGGVYIYAMMKRREDHAALRTKPKGERNQQRQIPGTQVPLSPISPTDAAGTQTD